MASTWRVVQGGCDTHTDRYDRRETVCLLPRGKHILPQSFQGKLEHTHYLCVLTTRRARAEQTLHSIA